MTGGGSCSICRWPGWARRPGGGPAGNSEPFSYESGFAVKWLIERQLWGEAALNFDSANGDLWIGDVGQAKVEEVDHLPSPGAGAAGGRGANLGHPLGVRHLQRDLAPELHRFGDQAGESGSELLR